MGALPLHLDLTDRAVLVVGAGPVGARRAATALAAGAIVEVIAEHVTRQLVPDQRLRVTERVFEATDVLGRWLVFACTDSDEVNSAIAQACDHARIFCIRADTAATGAHEGSALLPAVLRRGDITISISAGDPRRSVALREAIALGLDLDTLPARPTRPAAAGSVALVGGGPGDPELITVRGRRLVSEADVIVVDRLAPREILDSLADDVEIIDVGKSSHRHNLTQEDINNVLVDRARAGKRVVRLKGGDPFVFGRGSEEVAACMAAGITVTVVPGISSALAAPAAALIPLTHRGLAADFAVISGHHDPSSNSDSYDVASLAQGPATIVLLMGVEHVAETAHALICHGRPASTPAAVIHRATLADQRIVRTTLAELAHDIQAAAISAPSVIVIGEVAALPST